jgi:hypothetical protein
MASGYRRLCSRCANRMAAQHWGLAELETVEFEPLIRHDAHGREHTFHFFVHLSTRLGMRAFEWVDGEPGGYEFAVLKHPATLVRKVYEALVTKIESGLAQRYLVCSDFPDPVQNCLYIAGSALNGRIEERDGEPHVVIDGSTYSWEELGRFLSSYMGFNFRLECFDPCDDPPLTARPERPGMRWWQDRGEGDPVNGEGESRLH